MQQILVLVAVATISMVAADYGSPYGAGPRTSLEELLLSVDGSSVVDPSTIEEGYTDIKPEVLELVSRNTPENQHLCTYSVIDDHMIQQLRRILTFVKPTLYQKGFATTMFGLHVISSAVSEGTCYDDAYDTQDILLTLGGISSHLSRDTKFKFLNKVQEDTKDLKYVINQILDKCDGTYEVEDLLSCDRKVSSIVKRHPNLQKAANIMTEFGRLSVIYKKNYECEIDEVIKKHNIYKYFKNGKHHLKPFITQNAIIYKLIPLIN